MVVAEIKDAASDGAGFRARKVGRIRLDEQPHIASGKNEFVVRVLCAVLKEPMHGGTDEFGWLRLEGGDMINCWKNGGIDTASIVKEATNLLLKSLDFCRIEWTREVVFDGMVGGTVRWWDVYSWCRSTV